MTFREHTINISKRGDYMSNQHLKKPRVVTSTL